MKHIASNDSLFYSDFKGIGYRVKVITFHYLVQLRIYSFMILFTQRSTEDTQSSTEII